jgi:hypothetical protein
MEPLLLLILVLEEVKDHGPLAVRYRKKVEVDVGETGSGFFSSFSVDDTSPAPAVSSSSPPPSLVLVVVEWSSTASCCGVRSS